MTKQRHPDIRVPVAPSVALGRIPFVARAGVSEIRMGAQHPSHCSESQMGGVSASIDSIIRCESRMLDALLAAGKSACSGALSRARSSILAFALAIASLSFAASAFGSSADPRWVGERGGSVQAERIEHPRLGMVDGRRILLPAGSAVLAFADDAAPAGSLVRAALWLWSDSETVLRVGLHRHGSGSFEGIDEVWKIGPTPKRIEIEYRFATDQRGYRILLRPAGGASELRVYAWQVSLELASVDPNRLDGSLWSQEGEVHIETKVAPFESERGRRVADRVRLVGGASLVSERFRANASCHAAIWLWSELPSTVELRCQPEEGAAVAEAPPRVVTLTPTPTRVEVHALSAGEDGAHLSIRSHDATGAIEFFAWGLEVALDSAPPAKPEPLPAPIAHWPLDEDDLAKMVRDQAGGPPEALQGSSSGYTIDRLRTRVIAEKPGRFIGRSSLQPLPEGSWVLVYTEAGHHSHTADGVIHLRFSDDAGRSWSEEDRTLTGEPIGGFPGAPPGAAPSDDHEPADVMLYLAPDRTLILHSWNASFRTEPTSLRGTWQRRSRDGGSSWSEWSKIDFAGTDADDRIMSCEDWFVVNGTIYAGARRGVPGSRNRFEIVFIASADNGKTWTLVSDVTKASDNALEAGFVHLGGERILAVIVDSTHDNRATYQAQSHDMGRSWSELENITDEVRLWHRPRIFRNDVAQPRPELIGIGSERTVPGKAFPRRNAVWLAANANAEWQAPISLDAETLDAGYGDLAYDPMTRRYVATLYRGRPTEAALWAYRFGIVRYSPSAPGVFGRARRFNGFDSRITLGRHVKVLAGRTTGTVSFWIRTSVQQQATLFAAGSQRTPGSADSGLAISLTLEGRVSYTVSGRGGPILRAKTLGPPIDDGSWHHIAVVAGPSGVRLYLDGSDTALHYELGEPTATGFTADVDVADSWIGARGEPARDFFNGLIDDFRIYTDALSPGQIRSLLRAEPLDAARPSASRAVESR